MKKNIFLGMAMLIFLLFIGCSKSGSDSKIVFDDINMENAVREAIGKMTGDITEKSIENETGLDLSGKNIVSISGIESFKGLNYLNLDNNSISDVSRLKELKKLENLYLNNNNISDINELKNIASLKKLEIKNNPLDYNDEIVINELEKNGCTVNYTTFAKSIILFSSHNEFKANGEESISFRVEVYDNKGRIMENQNVDYYYYSTLDNDSKKFSGEFNTDITDEYVFYAMLGTLKSNELKIIAMDNIKRIELFVDKNNIIADNEDAVVFTLKGYTEENIEKNILNYTLYKDSIKINENIFKTSAEGEYTFYAEYDEMISNTITIKSEKQLGKIVFAVYIGGDNNLNGEGETESEYEEYYDMVKRDLDEIINAEIDKEKVEVVIYLDNKYYQALYQRGIYVKDGNKLNKVLNFIEPNTGVASTLQSFLEYITKNYADSRYILGIWGHGSGWWDDKYGDGNLILDKKADLLRRAISYDDTNNGDSLDLWELEKGIKDSKIGKLEIIYFDACLMGGIEVSYQLKDVSKYVVFAAELTPDTGGDYKNMLEYISINNMNSSKDIAQNMAKINLDSYKKGGSQYEGVDNSCTYSVVDQSKIDKLMEKLDILSLKLKENTNLTQEIAKILNNQSKEYFSQFTIDSNFNAYIPGHFYPIVTSYGGGIFLIESLLWDTPISYENIPSHYIDLGDFVNEIANLEVTSQDVKNAVYDFQEIYKEYVVYSDYQNGEIIDNAYFIGDVQEDSTGVSIFLNLYPGNFDDNVLYESKEYNTKVIYGYWTEYNSIYSGKYTYTTQTVFNEYKKASKFGMESKWTDFIEQYEKDYQ